jgi:hypothetical protein
MRLAALIGVALVVGVAQSASVVLSSDDIGDTYDEAPEGLGATKLWLGLFIAGTKPAEERGQSRVSVAAVRFVKSGEPGGGLKMETTPPKATLLVSGVRNIAPGPAITAAQFVDLWHEEPEAHITLGERQYIVRLISRDPGYCDAVVSLTWEAVTQKLFDMRSPGARWSCDEPHFRIHWAGDLDRDGRLDMLVTFSEKYSHYPRQLLLSSAARSTDLVAEVARYERFSQ